METREFGRTGMRITPIGFGAWAIGGGGWEFAWGPQDDEVHEIESGMPAPAGSR